MTGSPRSVKLCHSEAEAAGAARERREKKGSGRKERILSRFSGLRKCGRREREREREEKRKGRKQGQGREKAGRERREGE